MLALLSVLDEVLTDFAFPGFKLVLPATPFRCYGFRMFPRKLKLIALSGCCVVLGACGANAIGRMLEDAGRALRDAGTAHAQMGCSNWEVQLLPEVAMPNQIVTVQGWEPFSYSNGYYAVRRCR